MPTTVTKVVDPDNGPGTDYLSLAAFEAGEQRDLVVADEIAEAQCRSSAGSADTTAVEFLGWTTDATRYVKVVGDWDGSKWSTDSYRIESSVSNIFTNTEGAVLVIENLQIYHTSNSGGLNCLWNKSTLSVTFSVKNCFFKSKGFTARGLQCQSGNAGLAYNVSNCVFANFASEGLSVVNAGTYRIYNCTINNTGAAGIKVYNGGTVVLYNNIIQNATDPFVPVSPASGDNNCADVFDADIPGANSITATVTFTDVADGDFSLVAGSRGIDEGTDLSSDPNLPVTDDIKGVSRPQGAGFDMGAYEYVPTSAKKKKGYWEGWRGWNRWKE